MSNRVSGDDHFGVEGASFLRSDYTVSCMSKEYAVIQGYVYLCIFIYPVGLNVIEFLVLRSHRFNIVGRNGRARHISFLYEAFRPEYYYWECVDSIRRIMLSGFLVCFGEKSRPAVALLLAVCFQVSRNRARPRTR